MPSLATTNRFQQIDQKSLQTFMALSDLGLGHVRDYHGLKRVSILNVVILETLDPAPQAARREGHNPEEDGEANQNDGELPWAGEARHGRPRAASEFERDAQMNVGGFGGVAVHHDEVVVG